ncbi:hypothetical protein ACFY36_18085 [Actinoplanes sp. NPDC000266]
MIDTSAAPREAVRGKRRAAVGVWLALTVAALFAVAGARLGWTAAGDLPDERQMSSIVDTVLPNAVWPEAERHDYIGGSPDESPNWLIWGYDWYGPGFAAAKTGGIDLAGAAPRLAAAGWRVGEPADDQLTAANHQWRLAVYTDGSVDVQRSEPWLALVLAIVFGIAGGLLGWRLRTWAGVAGLGFLIPHTLVVPLSLGFDVAARFGTGQFGLLWEPLMSAELRLLTLVGAAVLLASLIRRAQASLIRDND